MDRVAIGPVKGLRIAIAAFILSVLLFTGVVSWGIYTQVQHQRDVEGFAAELHAGLVASCEKNGNPLREAVQSMLREEIRQTKPAQLHQFFPQIPEAQLNALIAQKVEANREVIRRIAPIDCAGQYPKP